MLLRSGRRTSADSVNITDRQAEYPNFHEPNVSEDINKANQTLKQLAALNLASQPPSITRFDLGKRMDKGQSSMMEAQLANLTAMHTTDMCPTLQEGEANAVFPNQRRYDPYSATHNEGWRDHPNLRYQNCATPPEFEQQNSRPYNMSQPTHQNPSAETKTHSMLEQMMKMMADQKKETDGRF
ncbi:hypothetical protein GOBAR_DD14333 [Gossypium barbadense]|nr:hypothetical protein GOBAR_DD14333 [Gossypium barbadense]